jgi:hypothetical protein
VSNALTVANAYISNLYTSNIVGFVGSQWTGTTGQPITYTPFVGIGSTDTPTSNLQVTGNVYVSNAVTTTNVFADFFYGDGSNLTNVGGGGFTGLATNAILYATSASSASTTATASNFYWDNTNSRLGLGTSSPAYPLHVAATGVASASSAYSNLAFQAGGWYQAYNPADTRTLKIYTDGNIGCAELDLFSDERIKKDIKDISEVEAESLVSRLRPRTFTYKDTIEYGNAHVNGLIAQEVRSIIPTAVSVHKGAIPDIFTSVHVTDNCLKVATDAFTIGDTLKILDGTDVHIVNVIDIHENEIKINKLLKGPEVFIYGHEVSDFHTISYERIVPLLISTIQSLQKRVSTLECLVEKGVPIPPISSDTHI